MKKIISLLMVLTLFCSGVFSSTAIASASSYDLNTDYIEQTTEFSDGIQGNSDLYIDSEYEISTFALPALVAPIIALILKKQVKKAIKDYGEKVVIDSVMKQLNLPKTISGKDLVKKLEKVGFEKVRQKGSHVTMKGPNGKTFTVPMHKEIAKGTYDSIKKSIKNSIVP